MARRRPGLPLILLRVPCCCSVASDHVNSPFAIAAAAERDPAAIGRPREFRRRRIRENAAHRPVVEVEYPGAAAKHLEDDLRAVGRHRRGADEATLDGRLELARPPAHEIQDDDLVLVRVTEAPPIAE